METCHETDRVKRRTSEVFSCDVIHHTSADPVFVCVLPSIVDSIVEIKVKVGDVCHVCECVILGFMV